MKKRATRIVLFAGAVIALAFLFNFYFTNIEGDGKKTPEAALPTDQNYEWIEGPKTEKEHRYFFLSNGTYFGTGTVTKNLTGWSSSDGVYAKLPNSLEFNEIPAAYSDSKILYGLIKPNGEISVTVNGVDVELIQLSSLSEEVVNSYNVKGYSIWYIDLTELGNREEFIIKVLDSNDEVLSEISI
ncbi:hypothetical protein [Ureibacillus acetophenoni]|uniref:Uncharacterized protein n=1 Tax=Ureibacillus acetophenoni TaxID=614649 RepID=A0A285U5N5_9BACL|nr:hypothetical protein [Ureibacillus acetophenoni]SOC37254.1 hypothetical protein SAMN05877842_103108 [Ureibacillus acetophenoni]